MPWDSNVLGKRAGIPSGMPARGARYGVVVASVNVTVAL